MDKLKRTYEALTTLIEETKDEITHLESPLQTSLRYCTYQKMILLNIKEELVSNLAISARNRQATKKSRSKANRSTIFLLTVFISMSARTIYQNDELTFKFATGSDWWFHAKGAARFPCDRKNQTGEELPDRTFEEAGRLAGLLFE